MRIKDLDDYKAKMLGETIDFGNDTTTSINESFCIRVHGKLLSFTAENINRIITKHASTDDDKTAIYLHLEGREGNLQLLEIGFVKLTMNFYLEIKSAISAYQTDIFNYTDKEFIPFDYLTLVPTIRKRKRYDNDLYV